MRLLVRLYVPGLLVPVIEKADENFPFAAVALWGGQHIHRKLGLALSRECELSELLIDFQRLRGVLED